MTIDVRMSSEYACFSRPEFPAEKTSYPIITPPAAVGAISAVFWKPEFMWKVRSVKLLAEPEWMTYRINGVKEKLPVGRITDTFGQIDAIASQTQIGHLVLVKPAYEVTFDITLKPWATKSKLAYFDQAQRRLDRGAFFKPPYLGMREHMAEVEPGTGEAPVAFTLPVGPMVHSYEFDADGNVSKTRFFDAKIINGVMDVPDRGTAQ